MMPGRRPLIGGLLAVGMAALFVVWLVAGGSSAPAGPTRTSTSGLTTSGAVTSAAGEVTWSAPRSSGSGAAASSSSSPAWSTTTASGSGGTTWSTTTASGSTGTVSSSTTGTATTQASGAVVVRPETLVATIRATGAPGSRKPGGPRRMWVPGHWLGARSILPVIGQQAGWVHVRLAQRPNESTAWVPMRYVSLATDPYHIVIDVSSTHLNLYREGRQIGSYPVGVGLPGTPTPTGHFFVALFARAPSPAWGAFVIVTSAHSNTISDWEETGDAITAIHGSLGSDAQIGTSGGQVSHGCVRMHDVQLLNLRPVPAGTLVDIHL